MSKIKVVQYPKYLDFAGTSRTAQLFYKYLNQDDRYECYIIYREGYDNCRLKEVQSWFGEDKVIANKWVPGKKSSISPYLPKSDDLGDILTSIKPDIVHVHRSGYNEHPHRHYYPKARWFETNIFGCVDRSGNIDKSLYVSDYIRKLAVKNGNQDGPVIYNPIELPPEDLLPIRRNARNKYGIDDSTLLLGRIGRADNFDDISLKALKLALETLPLTKYLVVNPCDNWRRVTKNLGIEDSVVFLPPTADDDDLMGFYAAIDIYCHARSDGDCCPVSIQQAMMYGVPCISHLSTQYNGQIEIIGDGGFVVGCKDYEEYANKIIRLADDSCGSMIVSRAAKRLAMAHYESSTIIEKLKNEYEN